MQYKWPLQKDIITEQDRLAMISFISTAERFTTGEQVERFEKEYSNWLEHESNRIKLKSLFVQSGSAANLLLFAALVHCGILKKGSRVAVPTITWGTTITPLKLFGLEPVWIDIDPETLTMNIEQLKTKNYDFIWVTHLAGMANDMNAIMKIASEKRVLFAEDCCQAYGATVGGRKVGTFGIASTSSFYFGHHMTTIEGGMLTFNLRVAVRELIAASEAIRSHGLSRAITDPHEKAIAESGFDWIDNRFLFSHLPMNFRNTEIQAVLGRNQLKRLDHFVRQRQQNFHHFSAMLETWKVMDTRLNIVKELPNTNNSSFCLPLVFKNFEDRQKFVAASDLLKAFETRPLAGGPIQSQPAFADNISGDTASWCSAYNLYANTVYVGNNHMIQSEDWKLFPRVWEEAFGK